MKTAADEVKVIPNRTMEIANVYHTQSLKLINLALNQNKLAIEAAHTRATELSQVKDAKKINQLVTQHLTSHVIEYLGFATAAYQLGFDAHTEVVKIFHQQIIDNQDLADEIFHNHSLANHPVSNMALSLVNGAFQTSQAVIESAKAAAEKTTELAKSALSTQQPKSRSIGTGP